MEPKLNLEDRSPSRAYSALAYYRCIAGTRLQRKDQSVRDAAGHLGASSRRRPPAIQPHQSLQGGELWVVVVRNVFPGMRIIWWLSFVQGHFSFLVMYTHAIRVCTY